MKRKFLEDLGLEADTVEKIMIDTEKVKYNEKFEIVEGLDEQLSSLKENYDYLFENDKTLPKFSGDITQPGSNALTKEVFNKMGYKERCKLQKEQPEVYNQLKEE